MPIHSSTTYDSTLVGARLYRRSVVQRAALNANGGWTYTTNQPVQAYSSEWVCGFYQTAQLDWLNLLGVSNEQHPLSHDYFVDGSALDAATKANLISIWEATRRPATIGLQTYLCGVVTTPLESPKGEPVGYVGWAPYDTADPGWDASAISTTAFFAAGRVKFRVKGGSKVVIGCQEGPNPLDPSSRFFGFSFSGPFVTVGLRGGNAATPDILASDTAHQLTRKLDDGEVYTVEVMPYKVTFSDSSGSVDLGLFGPFGAMWDRPGVWSLGAALFDPGSWVEGIEVVSYDGAYMTTKPMQMVAGKAPYKAFAKLVAPPLTMSAGLFTRATMALPKMRMRSSDRALAEGYLAMPAMQMSGSQLSAATTPYALLRTRQMQMVGRGKTGTIGRASMTVPSMRMRATKGNRADATLVAPPMQMFGYDIPAGQGFMFSSAFGSDTQSASIEVAVVINTTGGLQQSIAAAVLVPGAMNTAASLHDSLTLSQVLAALMETEVVVGADVPGYAQPGEVWVVGLSENSPTSTFENYDFNSFGVIGGRAYGVKGDGLYLLDGDTDDGAPIRASVSYGAQDFGTKTVKHMTRAYVGASSTGKLYLKIVADGKEYLYAARSSSEEIAQQRFDVGRGLQANYFTFELFNKDGGDFEIDSVSFFAAEFKRRI